MSAHEDQLRQAILSIRQLRKQLDAARSAAHEPLAIVGMGCRIPGGADSPEAFAGLLEAGFDAVRETPRERWDNELWYDADADVAGKLNTRWGAFLDDLDRFDCSFFELSEREVAEMDPQQRLLLEMSWEALERAAIAPASLAGSRSGVFIGINGAEYYQRGIEDPASITAHTLSGGVASAAAGRIAYQLGLHGPAIAIDTACSSSLAAVHQACRSLRSGETDLAIAGGIYVVLEPNLSVGLSRLHMLARDGRCKPFDARADGFVQGEGGGVVILKRLRDAQAAGDPVLAVIRGSAMNQDGRSVSLTAPSRVAQGQVIAAALDDAGIDGDLVGYIETHGTGTALGDPIECHALADVFAAHDGRPLVLGALKSNIGHLGPAAGIAGLIKAVIAIRQKRIPPNLHFERLNPDIDSGSLGLQFPTSAREFPEIEGRRIAGVSSFGFAGTNVHVVLEAADASQVEAQVESSPQLLLLSARSASALQEVTRRMLACLERESDFAAVCRSLALGRNALEHRIAVVATNSEQARNLLSRAHPQSARQRPRLALAVAERKGVASGWLDAAGIVPYAYIGPATLDPGGSAKVLEAGNSAALQKALVELGIGVVVTENSAAMNPELPAAVTAIEVCADSEEQRLQFLGQLFEIGFSINPECHVSRGRRLALPTTPFERQSCWRPRHEPVRAPERLPGCLLDGPLLGRQFRLRLGLARYPWLGDHRVDGQVLVPGAFQLACMHLAANSSGATQVDLQNVVFPRPLRLPEAGDIELWTVLENDAENRTMIRLATRNGSGDWVNHAHAETGSGNAVDGPLPAFKTDLQSPLDGVAWRSELASLGIEVGPAFAGLTRLYRGQEQALAHVQPIDSRSELDGCIHPAFLDACLQAAGGALPDSLRGKTLLPIGIERFSISALPAGKVLVHARCRQAEAEGEQATIDLRIADEDGRILIGVDGLGVRALHTERLSAGIANSLHGLLYQSASEVGEAGTATTGQRRLFVLDSATEAGRLESLLGPDDHVAIPGDALLEIAAARWTFATDQVGELLTRCAEVGQIVYCQCSGSTHAAGNGALVLASHVAAMDAPPRLTFVALASAGPVAAALSGLSATLALEQPQTRSRYILVDTLPDAVAASANDDDEDRIEVVRGTRSVSRVIAGQLEYARPPALGGSVLISGGFGGIGRALASWLLDRGVAGLILAGRRPDPTFAQQLSVQSGRPVLSLAADVGNADDISRIVAAAATMPPVRGIYHAAGAQAGGLLASLSSRRFSDAFDGKALGALRLHEASAQWPVEEFVMISSIASVLGAAGQGGYAPANAVLDALARVRRASGSPAMSVRLGRVHGAGMADALGAAGRARVDGLGIESIPIATALAALGSALAAGSIDPIIARIDWPTYAGRQPGGRLPPSLAALPGTASMVPADTPDDSPRAIFLAEIRRVASLSPTREVDIERSLVQMGLDSLMAIELRNRLRQRFGHAPNISTLLGNTSIGELLDDCAARGEVRATAIESASEWEDLIL